MKTIRRYFNNAEAEFARSLLVSAGIDARLAEERANTLGPGYAPGGVRLQVPDEDVARSQEILDGRSDEFTPLPDDFVPPPEEEQAVIAGGREEERPQAEEFDNLRGLIPAGLCVLAAIGIGCLVGLRFAPPSWVYSTAELVRMGNDASKKHDYAKAEEYYNAATHSNPRDPIPHLDLGLSYYSTHDYPKAMDEFTEAIKLNPRYARAYAQRGFTYYRMGMLDKAMDDLDQAAKVDPGNPLIHRERCEFFDNINEFEKALDEAQIAFRINPQDYKTCRERGYAYFQLGKYAEASADFQACLKLNPEDPWVYICTAYLHERKMEFDEALGDLGKALSYDPKLVTAYEERSFVYYRLYQYDKAMDDANKAISLDPANYRGYCFRGDVYSRTRDAAKALADYNHAVELEPSRWSGYNELAWMYATYPKDEVRDGTKALALAQKACGISRWKDGYCIGTLAAAEAETGNFGDAVKHQQQALAMVMPGKADQRTLDKMAEALADYQQGKPYRDIKQ